MYWLVFRTLNDLFTPQNYKTNCFLILYWFVFSGRGDGSEFSGELFDALARRKGIDGSRGITIEQMKVFWEDLTNEDLDTRIHIFFDM